MTKIYKNDEKFLNFNPSMFVKTINLENEEKGQFFSLKYNYIKEYLKSNGIKMAENIIFSPTKPFPFFYNKIDAPLLILLNDKLNLKLEINSKIDSDIYTINYEKVKKYLRENIDYEKYMYLSKAIMYSLYLVYFKYKNNDYNNVFEFVLNEFEVDNEEKDILDDILININKFYSKINKSNINISCIPIDFLTFKQQIIFDKVPTITFDFYKKDVLIKSVICNSNIIDDLEQKIDLIVSDMLENRKTHQFNVSSKEKRGLIC